MLDSLRNLFDPLFSIMGITLTTFHGWGAPWWLAIVMLTVVVRTLLFPVTYRQVQACARCRGSNRIWTGSRPTTKTTSQNSGRR